MARGEPVVRADWIAPDGVVHEYSAILPLACHVAAPQVLVVTGDTRDPFAALVPRLVRATTGGRARLG